MGITILYYDFGLTFAEELDRFWNKPFTLSSGLFFVNRYVGLLAQLPILVQLCGKPSPRVQYQPFDNLLSCKLTRHSEQT